MIASDMWSRYQGRQWRHNVKLLAIRLVRCGTQATVRPQGHDGAQITTAELEDFNTLRLVQPDGAGKRLANTSALLSIQAKPQAKYTARRIKSVITQRHYKLKHAHSHAIFLEKTNIVK